MKKFIIKSLYVAVIFLFLAILCKSNITYKKYIHKVIYEDNISFFFFKKVYSRYFGGVFPYFNNNGIVETFNEKIRYNNIVDYYDGAKVYVNDKYLVPLINDGIVIYTGNKEKYGNVIIIEDNNGIDTWYGNICNSSVRVFDNLNAGVYIGESCDNYIYLVYSKGDSYLDYEKYF